MRLGHAVVVGGGIAGLVTARILAEHAELVTVVERDRFPDGPEARKGVPQARHLHVLLQGGFHTVDRLLPGLVPALDRAGAVSLDWARDTKLMLSDGWYPRYESGLVGRFCSRSLLEHTLREQVALLPRIAFRTGCEVTGLAGSPSAVVGVRVRPRGDGQRGEESEVAADLVVDAAGRDSKLPGWLERLGMVPPQVSIVDAHLGYASRLYEPPSNPYDWRYLLVRTPTPGTRAGGISTVEGGRWLVTLGGYSRDYPPQGDDGFGAFAESLGVAEFAEALRAARPLTPAVTFRRTVNRIRHLDRLPTWPRGLIAVGDAVCTFNPIYGQGMSVALLSADLLGAVLARSDGRPFERTFQRRLARLLRDPWAMATGEDYRYPGTEGPARGLLTRASHWYAEQVTHAAVADVRVHRKFIEAIHMLRRPVTLARPDLAARVVVAAVRRRVQVLAFLP